MTMGKSSADLIAGWNSERIALQRQIVDLQKTEVGLVRDHENAAIADMADLIAEYDALIAEFGRHEPIPITFDVASDDEAHPVSPVTGSSTWAIDPA